MKVVVLGLATLVATGCMYQGASSGSAAQAGRTSLEITISLAGREAPSKVWTLRCPAGGTLPNAAQACKRLARIDKPFAPVPKNVACTEIYGGPQIAEVHGVFRGRPVNTRFTRTDGCEINRWNKVRFLFPQS